MNTSILPNATDENISIADILLECEGHSSEETIRYMEEIIQQLAKKHSTSNESLLKERETNRTMSQVISMASHEFRSPLSSIQLSAAVIEHYFDRMDKSKILAHLNKIQSAVTDMTGTLNDFLSVGLIGSGNINSVLSEFDLKSLSSEITGDMQLMLKDNQHLTYLHKGNNTQCRLDPYLLKHCIVNLLFNAIKYSGKKGLIKFETEIQDNRCLIRVKDNGIGIPKKDQPYLFDAFFRASNTGDIPGTGLGLNIVNRYVKLMNGIIQIKSSMISGTLFSLIFPV